MWTTTRSLTTAPVAGAETDTVGWPFVFFFNLPVGAVVLVTVRRYLPLYHPAGERPRIDYPGAALFAAALVPILVGLTNKQTADWGDPAVGGLIGLGAILLVALVWGESRAVEPSVPLGLFRNRSFSVSVASVFLAASGFLTAAVFLPRWFQVVLGSSATVSGYQMLPLLGGVIVSATAAGQIVSRTGRYRPLVFGAMVMLATGLGLLTQLRADTALPVLWAWMFVTGLGVGPMLSVFPLIVQNSVPVTKLGTATSSVTFFQQVGGTVGLAITGTVFATSMTRELPAAIGSAGVPPQVGRALAGLGEARQRIFRWLISKCCAAASAVHLCAFTCGRSVAPGRAAAIAARLCFTIGIVATVAAAGLVLLLRDAPVAAAAGAGLRESEDGETAEVSASAA